jgi:tRNA(fMet)-specific endonuclease VapC
MGDVVLILDTDHLSALDRRSAPGAELQRSLSAEDRVVAISIVTVEEQLRGWLARIAKLRDPARLVAAYGELQDRLDSFSRWIVLPWDMRAAATFQQLRHAKLRVSTLDLRIASIVIAADATLLTRNLRDFGRVPGLKVENWLDR